MPLTTDEKGREHSIEEIENWNLDRSVEPPTKVIGIMGRTSAGNWVYLGSDAGQFRISAVGVSVTGAISARESLSALGLEGTAHIGQVSATLVDDATVNKFLGRVSALGVTATSSPLSADSSQVSALQGDAAKLRISAIQDGAAALNISAKSNDAGLLRVSSWMFDGEYSNASPNVIVSARSVSPTSAMKGLVTVPVSPDGAYLRISAVQLDANNLHVSARVSNTVTVTQTDPAAMIVSGSSDNAGGFRVSAFQTAAGSLNVSAKSLDGGTLRVSAVQDGGAALNVSCKSNDGALLRVSSVQDGAAALNISAKSNDAGTLHVSAYNTAGAGNLLVSARSDDAGLTHVSAYMPVDTVGQLSVFQTLSISASQSVKGGAGTLYGYYFYNTDTKPNYVKLYNVSAAASIGTDTPLMTICLPASAAANAWFGQGLKGFTAGINVTATSGRPLDNTAAPAASAVGGDLFYN